MEGLSVIFWLIMLVVAILQIILFFKIWGMTNDVRDLKEFLLYNKKPVDYSTYKPNKGGIGGISFSDLKGDYMNKSITRKFAQVIFNYYQLTKTYNYSEESVKAGITERVKKYGKDLTSQGIDAQKIAEQIMAEMDSLSAEKE